PIHPNLTHLARPHRLHRQNLAHGHVPPHGGHQPLHPRLDILDPQTHAVQPRQGVHELERG
ncbi:hypothetical protein HK104_004418, partial [Borealophlyctis nickersoniae]